MLGEQIKMNFVECVYAGVIHYVFENWSYTSPE